MQALLTSWWFRIPFVYWLLGILLYPPAYDRPEGGGFVRERVWAWTYIGEDWKGTMLLDWGTILWQFCILLTLVAIVRWVAGVIGSRLRRSDPNAGSTRR